MKKCCCNYKSFHSFNKFQMVSRITYYKHLNHDKLGEIHPSVLASPGAVALEQLPYEDHHGFLSGDTIENEIELDTPNETSPQNQYTNHSSESRRRVWCTCKGYCNNGCSVVASTKVLHERIAHRHNAFAYTIGL